VCLGLSAARRCYRVGPGVGLPQGCLLSGLQVSATAAVYDMEQAPFAQQDVVSSASRSGWWRCQRNPLSRHGLRRPAAGRHKAGVARVCMYSLLARAGVQWWREGLWLLVASAGAHPGQQLAHVLSTFPSRPSAAACAVAPALPWVPDARQCVHPHRGTARAVPIARLRGTWRAVARALHSTLQPSS
jgi:hypothetical protein